MSRLSDLDEEDTIKVNYDRSHLTVSSLPSVQSDRQIRSQSGYSTAVSAPIIPRLKGTNEALIEKIFTARDLGEMLSTRTLFYCGNEVQDSNVSRGT